MTEPPPSSAAQAPPATAAGHPAAVLGLGQAVALIVGIVVGAGIFKAPSMVAGMTGSTGWMFGTWIAGGAVTLAGALCYAELACAYPHAGGDYHFLHRAYGRRVSFLYAWSRFSVVTTGSIALLAFVFGDYMTQVLPLGPHGASLYAAASVAVLALVNLRGLRSGAGTQTWLTLLEVAGLLLVVVAGLSLVADGAPLPLGTAAAATDGAGTGGAAAAAPPSASALGLAMVFVLLTYGGWNEAAYLSAEIRHRERNMVRALLWSTALITGLYLLVNAAYWQGLGLDRMARSDAVAADLLAQAFGETGRTAIALLVSLSALTSMNATMIFGARTSWAVGADWPSLSRLGAWDGQRHSPTTAMLLQAAMSLALVGVGALAGGGFKAMVEFTAPVFWLFFLAAGLSLFVLRRRDPARPRPYRVPLYPLLPALFCGVCAFMLWSSLSYVYRQEWGGLNAAWIAVGVLAAGGLAMWAAERRS